MPRTWLWPFDRLDAYKHGPASFQPVTRRVRPLTRRIPNQPFSTRAASVETLTFSRYRGSANPLWPFPLVSTIPTINIRRNTDSTVKALIVFYTECRFEFRLNRIRTIGRGLDNLDDRWCYLLGMIDDFLWIFLFVSYFGYFYALRCAVRIRNIS